MDDINQLEKAQHEDTVPLTTKAAMISISLFCLIFTGLGSVFIISGVTGYCCKNQLGCLIFGSILITVTWAISCLMAINTIHRTT